MTALQALRAPILMTFALAFAFGMALFICGYVARAVLRTDGGLGKPYSEEQATTEPASRPEVQAAA